MKLDIKNSNNKNAADKQMTTAKITNRFNNDKYAPEEEMKIKEDLYREPDSKPRNPEHNEIKVVLKKHGYKRGKGGMYTHASGHMVHYPIHHSSPFYVTYPSSSGVQGTSAAYLDSELSRKHKPVKEEVQPMNRSLLQGVLSEAVNFVESKSTISTPDESREVLRSHGFVRTPSDKDSDGPWYSHTWKHPGGKVTAHHNGNGVQLHYNGQPSWGRTASAKLLHGRIKSLTENLLQITTCGICGENHPESVHVKANGAFATESTEVTSQRVLDAAHQAGHNAFHAGMKAVPAHDKAVLELIHAHGKLPGHTINILNSWTKGWHKANMAAPVKEELVVEKRTGIKHPNPINTKGSMWSRLKKKLRMEDENPTPDELQKASMCGKTEGGKEVLDELGEAELNDRLDAARKEYHTNLNLNIKHSGTPTGDLYGRKMEDSRKGIMRLRHALAARNANYGKKPNLPESKIFEKEYTPINPAQHHGYLIGKEHGADLTPGVNNYGPPSKEYVSDYANRILPKQNFWANATDNERKEAHKDFHKAYGIGFKHGQKSIKESAELTETKRYTHKIYTGPVMAHDRGFLKKLHHHYPNVNAGTEHVYVHTDHPAEHVADTLKNKIGVSGFKAHEFRTRENKPQSRIKEGTDPGKDIIAKYKWTHLPSGRTGTGNMTFDHKMEMQRATTKPQTKHDVIAHWNKQQPKTWKYELDETESVVREAKKFRPPTFDQGKEVRSIARERIGQPPTKRIITSKKFKKEKYKPDFTKE